MNAFLKSIRAQLLIVVLVSIIPALGIILYSGFESRKEAVKEAEQSAMAVLHGLAAENERVEEGTRQLLMTLAQLRDVQNLDSAAGNRLLGKLLIQNFIYANLFVADARGKVVASALPSISYNVQHLRYFQDALNTKDFSVDEYAMGPSSTQPVLHLSYPILDSRNRFKGVVVAAIDLTVFGNLYFKARLPQGSILTATDRAGIRLFRYPDPDRYVGTADFPEKVSKMTQSPAEGIFTRSSKEGDYLVAYRRFNLRENTVPYLLLSVEIPKKQALAEVRRLLRVNLALFAIAFSCAVICALVIGKAAIERRFNALVDASLKLGKGDLTSRTGLPHERDELGHLAEVFDDMADKLERKELGRSEAEAALRESEERYRVAIEGSNDGIAIMRGPVHVYVNRRFVEMFGYESPSQIMGMPNSITVHPDDFELVNDINIRRQRGEAVPKRYEFKGIRKDGTPLYLEASATNTVYRGNPVSLTYLRDVTDRKRAEETLRRAEEKYRSIFENAVEGIFQISTDGRYLSVNPALVKMYGYDSPREMTDAAHAIEKDQYVSPADRLALADLYARQGFVEAFETEVYRKDGGRVWISMNARAVKGPDGDVEYYEGTVEDITIRKKAGETLRDSEETLRALVNATRETLLLIDRNGTVLVANEVVARRLHTTVGKLIGARLYDFFEPDVARLRKAHYEMVFTTGEWLHYVDAREGRLYDTYTYPVLSADGAVSRVAIFAHDITERARAEEEKAYLESQLRQSQKMEAIGTLAGGIAHDFNNILTAIIGYGSLLQMNMEASDPKKIYADHILASSQKAAALTQSLLAFGRKQVIELKARKVGEVIGEAEELLKRLLTEDIEFRVIRRDEDMVVKADVTQIAQVLMNLVTNARDAMPKGGKLTLKTEAVTLGSEFIQAHGFGETGDYALVSVTDTGIGMDQKTREKIFEPFFTTKEVGKGTGLGLSIVYGIVKQHNGYISVSSEPGKGTSFMIYLPVIKTRVKEITGVSREVTGGVETILVAEDNDEVRRLAREILTSRGYTVIEAEDGEDAVRRFMDHKEEIDLLLLDVVMPRMNGKEAYEAIKKAKPGVRVLFTSGYTGDVVLDKGVRDESINFISKPLSPDELLRKVREVLA